MSFMGGVKGLGRTILGSNEAIQRGGQRLFNKTDDFISLAGDIANEKKVGTGRVKRAFNDLMDSDEGFSKQFAGKDSKDIDKAQAVAQHYQANKEVYDSDLASQKAMLEKMQGGKAKDNFELLREARGHDDTVGGSIATFGNAAKGYLLSGSKKTNATRYAAIGAGHMGLSFVGRSLTGGSMGYNNQGERDIAGLPFV